MDDFNLSALSGISSNQSSGFLGEDSGLFQGNENKNNDSDNEPNNIEGKDQQAIEDSKTAEVKASVWTPSDRNNDNQKPINESSNHNKDVSNEDPSAQLEVERRDKSKIHNIEGITTKPEVKTTNKACENKRKLSLNHINGNCNFAFL